MNRLLNFKTYDLRILIELALPDEVRVDTELFSFKDKEIQPVYRNYGNTFTIADTWTLESANQCLESFGAAYRIIEENFLYQLVPHDNYYLCDKFNEGIDRRLYVKSKHIHGLLELAIDDESFTLNQFEIESEEANKLLESHLSPYRIVPEGDYYKLVLK